MFLKNQCSRSSIISACSSTPRLNYLSESDFFLGKALLALDMRDLVSLTRQAYINSLASCFPTAIRARGYSRYLSALISILSFLSVYNSRLCISRRVSSSFAVSTSSSAYLIVSLSLLLILKYPTPWLTILRRDEQDG